MNKSQINHLAKANHCNLSQEAKEWINGELLGDGSIRSHNVWSAQFRYGSKYLEYCRYVKEILAFFEIAGGNIYKQYHKIFNCYSYHYDSFCYVELLPIKKQWYPNNKKIVPKDIELTPLTCRQWYIGDGMLAHFKKKRPCIILFTYAFSIDDIEWLVEELNKLGFKTVRQPSCNRIHISAYSTQNFLNYIGKCPVNCYKYKWDYY